MNLPAYAWFCLGLACILLFACGCGTAKSAGGASVATPPIVSQVVAAAAAGNWRSLAPLLTPEMQSLITPDAANEITTNFRSLGPLESIATLSQPSLPGTKQYAFTVHLAKGDIQGDLALDSAGKIAGLRFQPGVARVSAYVTKGDVRLPFRGEWYALWGGTDPAKNQPHMQAGGSQRYAYDVLIMKNGATHAGAGDKNTDYYCYGRPILSPVAGKVITVVDGIPENSPGEMNTLFLPGNCVVIDDGVGEYFALCHLQPGRMAVKVGDQVHAGQVIGYCGNSGNATQPHLHFQMADGPDLVTANGLPITFRHFRENGQPVQSGIAEGKVFLANQGTK